MSADGNSPTSPVIGLSRCPLPDVEIAFDQAGPEDGELVILLHGFPECRRAWRRQAAGLAAVGFRVVLPDQRGYGLSSTPQGTAAYDLDALAGDVVGLARHLGHECFNLVGHDWGASVAWWLASQDPDRVRRLAVANAPHPAVWREAMGRDWRQALKSFYVRIMALPLLPEALVRRGNFQALADALAPAGLTPEELAEYRKEWAAPGAVTGMINWYRAFLARRMPPAAGLAVEAPTLILWGDRDPYGVPELADSSARLCTNVRVEHFAEAGHWLHHEQADRVGEMLVEFLQGRVAP